MSLLISWIHYLLNKSIYSFKKILLISNSNKKYITCSSIYICQLFSTVLLCRIHCFNLSFQLYFYFCANFFSVIFSFRLGYLFRSALLIISCSICSDADVVSGSPWIRRNLWHCVCCCGWVTICFWLWLMKDAWPACWNSPPQTARTPRTRWRSGTDAKITCPHLNSV